MLNGFNYILSNYIDNTNIVDGNSELYNQLVRKLPSEIKAFFNKRADIVVKGSMGQGNKTEFPWISILNRNITTSTQEGLYVVFLFKKDMTGFYLTLNQGITHYRKIFERNDKAYSGAISVADYFKSQVDDTSFSKGKISLGAKKTDKLGYGYEQTNILSKYYEKNNFTEEELKKDLIEIMYIYDLIFKHMGTQSYDEIIKDVLRYEKAFALEPTEATDKIREAIDKDGDLPYGFTRTITEVKPYCDKTNKFARLTKPKVGKIDYLRKAVRDIKAGLLGEELVIKYEQDRLRDAGFDEYAEKVRWISQESDMYGYDIESFDVRDNGEIVPIKIEVKTTTNRVDTDFFVSKNELEKSRQYKKSYWVYRIYDVNSPEPKFYKANGPIEDNFILDPVTFMARYKSIGA